MDDNDWEVGFTNNDKEHLYEVVVELWQVGELYPNELNFLPYVFYGKMQPYEMLSYRVWSYHHEPKKILMILDEATNVNTKINKV